jgi:hypothetical protein
MYAEPELSGCRPLSAPSSLPAGSGRYSVLCRLPTAFGSIRSPQPMLVNCCTDAVLDDRLTVYKRCVILGLYAPERARWDSQHLLVKGI